MRVASSGPTGATTVRITLELPALRIAGARCVAPSTPAPTGAASPPSTSMPDDSSTSSSEVPREAERAQRFSAARR